MTTQQHTFTDAPTTSDVPRCAAPEGCPIVAFAWPTGRPIRAYTRDELAAGVDLYTRAMKARAASAGGRRAPR